MTLRLLTAAAALVLSIPLLGAGETIPGLRGSGTIVVQANVQGQPITVGGTVALYHKNAAYRLDVLSLGFPGTSGDLSAVASSLIAPGGFTVVYDGTTGSMIAWSNANHAYYVFAAARNAAAPTSPATVAAAAGGDPLSALAGVAAALRDAQTASIQLTGHAVLNGHPTTDLDVQMRRTLPGKPAENYHAQLALADDLAGFPVQMTLQSVPATPSALGGTMKLDLTNVQAANPDDAMFAVPPGYARASSPSAILGHALP